MRAAKKEPTSKRTTKAAPRAKALAKSTKRTKVKRSPSTRPAAGSKKPENKIEPVNISGFPPESIMVSEKWLCVACVLDVFTRYLKLAPAAANLQMKRYTPSLSELYAAPARPWFVNDADQDLCPYCDWLGDRSWPPVSGADPL